MNFSSYIKIIRPINSFIVFISVFVSAVMIDKSFENFKLIFFASSAAFFFSSAAMVINDYFDCKIDKINRPNRPIASGKISKDKAIIYFIILNLIALIFNFQLPGETMIIGIVSAIIIYFYSKKFKKEFLIGNIIVAFMTGLTFIYGGSISGFKIDLLIPFSFAFLIMLSREIIKTIEDFDGDSKNNVNSIAIKIGKRNSAFVAKILLTLLFISDNYFYFNQGFSFNYFLIVNLTVNLAILISIFMVTEKNNFKYLRLSSNCLKYSLFGGVVALFLK